MTDIEVTTARQGLVTSDPSPNNRIAGLLLAKIFNFGKYVRLTVCYLPKNGKYVRYLPKFHFWQVCSFNGLYVCMYVCLSVCPSSTR